MHLQKNNGKWCKNCFDYEQTLIRWKIVKPNWLCCFKAVNLFDGIKVIAKFTTPVQVNLFQKHLFLHQLTHNLTKDCSWNFHENYKCKYGRIVWAEHVLPVFCACSFHGNSMNNLLPYCGLIDAKTRASEKDLPVLIKLKNLVST